MLQNKFKNKRNKTIFFTIFTPLLLALSCIVFFFSCEKDLVSDSENIGSMNIAKESQNGEKFTISNFVYKMLNATNVKSIKFENKENCKVVFRDGNVCEINFSELDKSIISLDFVEGKYKFFSKNDTLLIVQNVTTGEETEYQYVSDETDNIDKVITTSFALMAYFQEAGAVDLDLEEPSYAIRNYWCINPRKSYCSKEKMDKKMKDYCGHTPSYVGETDCGCVFGDFGCVCVTDFEC